MIVRVEINFNTHTRNIIGTLIEGISYYERDYRKPNATNAKWSLKVKTNVVDSVLNVACMATGRSLHKSGAKITATYRKKGVVVVKTENITDDTFSKNGGVVIFKSEISL